VEPDKTVDTITFVTDTDILTVKEKILDVGGWLFSGIVPIGDKIEPLIEKAHLINYQSTSENDSLIVAFSEKIKTITKSKPFYLKSMKNNGIRYSLKLKNIDNTDSIALFHVLSIEGKKVDFVREGDSIWIAPDDNVGDSRSNYQDHPDNRRRAITLERHLLPFTLHPNSITPVDVKDIQNKTGQTIPKKLLQSLHEDNKKEMIANKNCGMLIQVLPDNIKTLQTTEFLLRGTLTIFDGIGNTVISNRKMGYHEESKSLNFGWTCKNSHGRFVGAGTYVAYIEVLSKHGPDLEIEKKHEPFQILLGIKK